MVNLEARALALAVGSPPPAGPGREAWMALIGHSCEASAARWYRRQLEAIEADAGTIAVACGAWHAARAAALARVARARAHALSDSSRSVSEIAH